MFSTDLNSLPFLQLILVFLSKNPGYILLFLIAFPKNFVSKKMVSVLILFICRRRSFNFSVNKGSGVDIHKGAFLYESVVSPLNEQSSRVYI